MRLPLYKILLPTLLMLSALPVCGQESQPVQLATHNRVTSPAAKIDEEAIERIRHIVLSQGEDARALANLVQLSRTLPASATCRLYYELSTDYLQRGKYNQAANVLQQLLNQFPQEPQAQPAVLRLVHLYASGEVSHSQSVERDQEQSVRDKAGFSKYAQHVAGTAVLANPALADDVALTYQRSVAMRSEGRLKASLSALSRIKRNPKLEPWRTRALAEVWLTSDRKDEPPLSALQCLPTQEHPHLDGVLDDNLWRANVPVQFAYNDEFLYFAMIQPKHQSQTYAIDARARSYDADLSEHDRVQLRLDVDRDYATCYELVVDHRGWTNDRCWLETGWNPKWFVAANVNDTHWSVEAAIPFDALALPAPHQGDAWVVSTQRILPAQTAAQPSDSQGEEFRLMLFQ